VVGFQTLTLTTLAAPPDRSEAILSKMYRAMFSEEGFLVWNSGMSLRKA
jgi:hypothetical protein